MADKINSFQANMICQIFAKDFGGTENIINCDKYQFTKLLIILYKLVKEIGLDDLASLLVAKKDSYLMNRLNARYINKKLLSNPLYFSRTYTLSSKSYYQSGIRCLSVLFPHHPDY